MAVVGERGEPRIRAMFDTIAPSYDRLNRILSFGMDVLWRRVAARRARLDAGEVALDVGCGTADLALALLAASAPSARVVGLDLSSAMFALAREKALRAGAGARLTLVQGSVARIPAPDRSYDRVVSAFTVRNLADLAGACGEMRRVLKPGGRCVILELARPTAPLFARVYRGYFNRAVPRIAALFGGDPAAYAYLPRSLEPFPRPRAFGEVLQRAGFRGVRFATLTLGIATIHEGAA